MYDDPDSLLSSYFTDVEHLRGPFREWVVAPELRTRLLVIHGVGGVGKSSLLRMFRLHCKSVGLPVALASGDEANTPLDVLTLLADDLSAEGVKLPSFTRTLERLNATRHKVEERAGAAAAPPNLATHIAGKAASRTAEVAGGVIAGAAIGSVIPGVGTAIGGVVGSVIGGMGADALVAYLHGFLKQPEIDLLLDPAARLTQDLIDDLGRACDRKRHVLMIDTFERMSALEDWVCGFARRSPENAVLVIAGRALPDWDRAWPGWMAGAQVEELRPMTEQDMRDLVSRYHGTMRGGEPDPRQVDAIVGLARGLPIVVTSAVQLWVKYGVEDFQAVKPEIIADLVDRLMEGVPANLIPALEAAAVVRWFDQPVLRAVMGAEDVRSEYAELRRFPFVRTRIEGFALHDAVRELIDENLRVQDRERHRQLHSRAEAYFEQRLAESAGADAERFTLETLYHRFRRDENAGTELFRHLAEEAVRYRLAGRLRAILNDANTYPLEQETSRLWREYYVARLAQLERRLEQARDLYRDIFERSACDALLHAYVLVDYGETVRSFRDYEEAIELLEEGVAAAPDDPKTMTSLHALAGAYRWVGRHDDAWKTVETMRERSARAGDTYGLVTALDRYEVFYTADGDFRSADATRKQREQMLESLQGDFPYLAMYVRGGLGFHRALLSGRYREVEDDLRGALRIARDLQATNAVYILRDLGFVLALQGRHDEATGCFEESLAMSDAFGGFASETESAITEGFLGFALKHRGALDEAERMLLPSARSKRESRDMSGIPELEMWLGQVREIRAQAAPNAPALREARAHYLSCIEAARTVQTRHNFACGAYAGLARVSHALGDHGSVDTHIAEAETISRRYEYNDQLASLRLTQGHVAWERTGDAGTEAPRECLLRYQQALVHALRFNRFALDEVLVGRAEGTPLRPIVPYCLDRGDSGRDVLVALREWWLNGTNDVGEPRPDTISPLAELIPLIEAERLAREREPGDGRAQRGVIELIDSAIADPSAR